MRIGILWGIIFVFFITAALFWYASVQLPESFLDRLDKAEILLGYFLGCFAFAIVFLGWVQRLQIRRWLWKRQFRSFGAPFDVSEEKVTAIVIPVSRREQPEWIINWLQPRHVSFLYSEHADSKNAAVALAQKYEHRLKFYPTMYAIRENAFILKNPNDPSQSKKLVHFFLQQFQEMDIPRNEIFVDTTGGKAPMSIGAFQAAEETHISSIYVVGTKDGFIKDPMSRGDGDPQFISDHTDF